MSGHLTVTIMIVIMHSNYIAPTCTHALYDHYYHNMTIAKLRMYCGVVRSTCEKRLITKVHIAQLCNN